MTWVTDVLSDIYTDFETHVVHIRRRRDLMLAIDLSYHSTLSFTFNSQPVEKGVVEILVIGDTRSGKSHTAKAMQRHYRLGDMINSEGVTMAGLLGGIDEGASGRGRFVRCGRIPLNHKRIVILDEANEIPLEILAKFSGFRSSGVFDLVKIIQQKIPCRVRLIWIANPRGDKDVDGYSHGVESVPEVIGKKEDIARFDMAIIVSRQDIDKKHLHRVHKKVEGTARWSSDICHNKVLFAWTRRPEHIVFGPGVEKKCLELAEHLSDSYSDQIPLVIETEQPIKVARMAVALAATTFSTEDDVHLVVEKEHVDALGEYLDSVYQHRSMDYLAWSKKSEMGELEPVMKALGKSGVTQVLRSSRITQRKFEAIFRDKEAGTAVWSELMLIGAVMEDTKGRWLLTPDLIKKMKQSQLNGLRERPSIPLAVGLGKDDGAEDDEGAWE